MMDMIDAPHTILTPWTTAPQPFSIWNTCGVLNVSSTARIDRGALIGSRLLAVNWLFDLLKCNLGKKMERKEHKISWGEICSVWFNNLNLVLSHAHQPTTITRHCSKHILRHLDRSQSKGKWIPKFKLQLFYCGQHIIFYLKAIQSHPDSGKIMLEEYIRDHARHDENRVKRAPL